MSGSGGAVEGMVGRGYYDRHSTAQADAIAHLAGFLETASARLPRDAGELRIFDYGCGPGRNSVAAIRIVLEALRRRAPDVPVVVTHNDVLENDWNGLFARVAGADGYLEGFGPVRTEASPGSFFGRVAGDASIDFALSFAAAHWLAAPIELDAPGTLFFRDLPEPARSEMAAVAARDRARFLHLRASELKPGADFVVDMLASQPGPDGVSAGQGLYRALWRVAEDMAGADTWDRALLDPLVFPVYFPTSDEVLAPLERDPQVVAAFEVVDLVNEALPMPLTDVYRANGDAAAYAAGYAGFARAFAEPVLRRALFLPAAGGDAARADALAQRYFTALEAVFADDPEAWHFDHQVLTLVLRRK
ncbi:MAG: hypothetical protein AAGH83_03535 [Pseudomonadota bacterium]